MWNWDTFAAIYFGSIGVILFLIFVYWLWERRRDRNKRQRIEENRRRLWGEGDEWKGDHYKPPYVHDSNDMGSSENFSDF